MYTVVQILCTILLSRLKLFTIFAMIYAGSFEMWLAYKFERDEKQSAAIPCVIKCSILGRQI